MGVPSSLFVAVVADIVRHPIFVLQFTLTVRKDDKKGETDVVIAKANDLIRSDQKMLLFWTDSSDHEFMDLSLLMEIFSKEYAASWGGYEVSSVTFCTEVVGNQYRGCLFRLFNVMAIYRVE